jgi:hypothetical protein
VFVELLPLVVVMGQVQRRLSLTDRGDIERFLPALIEKF